MSFRYTALHRELGLEPQDLTWAIILDAIKSGVCEQTDLDWKREGYAKDKEELAKDAAAMANSGGGIIVLGIVEDKKTSAAVRLHDQPVALNDAERRSYRQRIASHQGPDRR